jgi:hypothetical protein
MYHLLIHHQQQQLRILDNLLFDVQEHRAREREEIAG